MWDDDDREVPYRIYPARNISGSVLIQPSPYRYASVVPCRQKTMHYMAAETVSTTSQRMGSRVKTKLRSGQGYIMACLMTMTMKFMVPQG